MPTTRKPLKKAAAKKTASRPPAKKSTASSRGPALKEGSGEAGDIKKFRAGVKGGASGKYLKRIPADGITVRFLTEPTQWFKYWEHFDDSRKNNFAFPCLAEDCEGCETLSEEPSKRYLANVLDVENNQVLPLVLPASLAATLLKRYDRFKTLMDRDYELSKEGSGMKTEYTETYDGPRRRDLGRYDLLPLRDILLGQLEPEDEDDDDEDDRPRRRAGKKSPPSRRRPKDEDDEYDDEDSDDDYEDDEDDEPRRRPPARKSAARKPMKKALPKRR